MELLAPFWLLLVLSSGYFSGSEGVECRSKHVTKTIEVDKSGRGEFNTIQNAIDSISDNNNNWIKIHIHPGVYVEQVTIPMYKSCIILSGNDRKTTRIIYGAHEQTDTSATFSSHPDNVIAKRITFVNSYNRPEMMYGGTKEEIKQAVAARVYGDKTAFVGCGFLGLQDTLFDVEGRHYYTRCYFEGSTDFIFGSGQSFFEDCHINATSGQMNVGVGYVTAQSRVSANDPSGFVFERGAIFGKTRVFLGRAYGPYSRVVFKGTRFGKVIVPRGWNAWHFQGGEKNIQYAEINCTGQGSDTRKRVGWAKIELSANEENQFSRSSFIDKDGWISMLPIR